MAITPRYSVGIVALIIAVLTTCLAVKPVNDPDYHWHLATGRYILEHHEIPNTDVFSHTYRGERWRHIDWLSEVAMYFLHQADGVRTLTIIFAFLGGVGLALACLVVGRSQEKPIEVLVIGLILIAACLFRITPRPQTISLPALAVVLLFIDNALKNPRWLFGIPILVALWVNLHATAFIGILVTGAVAVGTTIEWRLGRRSLSLVRIAWITVGASGLAYLCAPHPFVRVAALFEYGSDPLIPELITEYAPIWWIDNLPLHIAIGLLTIFAFIGFVIPTKRPPIHEALIGGGLLFMGAMAVRFVPLSALGLAPLAFRGVIVVFQRVRGWTMSFFRGATIITACALIAPQAEWPEFGLGEDLYPIGAADFVERYQPNGRLYNDFHYGGYLMFRLGTDYPVFIDGRTSNVYPMSFLAEVARGDIETMQMFIRRFDLGIVVAAFDERVEWFQTSQDWAVVYFDDMSFVAIQRQGNEELVRQFEYSQLNLYRPMTSIGRFASDVEALSSAERETMRAVSAAPRSALPRVFSAEVALARGRLDRARESLMMALELRPNFPPALRGFLIICVRSRDRRCACATSEVILESITDDPQALRIFQSLDCGRKSR